MKPQSTDQDDLLLFQAHFDQMLNPAHPLLKLDGQIDWEAFDAAWELCSNSVDEVLIRRRVV